MRRLLPRLLGGGVLFLACLPAAAQHSVRLYSEFLRVDPFGEILEADRPRDPKVRPREILSPAAARNGFASFRIAVTVPPGEEFSLTAGQNPEAFELSFYRERFVRLGDFWIPDGLGPITLPYGGILPEGPTPIPGQTTVTFWMDIWVPPDAKVDRIRVEVQVFSGDYWIVYPIEVRVLGSVVPEPDPPVTPLGAAQQPADATVRGLLTRHLCGAPERRPRRDRNIRYLMLRNALQDMALARSLEDSLGNDVLFGIVSDLTGADDATRWCKAPDWPVDLGPEWYLRVRDAVFRMAN